MLERLTVKERIELRRPVAKAQGNSEPNPIDAESEAVEQDLEQDSGQGSSPPIGRAQSICPKRLHFEALGSLSGVNNVFHFV